MFIDINNKEEENSSMPCTSISEHEESKKLNEEPKDSQDEDENNQPFLQKMIISSELNYIQPRATKVWKYDEIGFYPNGMWNKVICNYNLFQGK